MSVAKTKRYVATAPLVVVRDVAGSDQYVYAGREITFDVDAERIEQLLEGGFIAEVEAPSGDDAPVFDGPPAKGANTDVWKAYAKSQGMDPAEADSAKKKDLVEKYLGADDAAGDGSSDGSDDANAS